MISSKKNRGFIIIVTVLSIFVLFFCFSVNAAKNGFKDREEIILTKISEREDIAIKDLMLVKKVTLNAGNISRAKVLNKKTGKLYDIALDSKNNIADKKDIDDLLRIKRKDQFIGKLSKRLAMKRDILLKSQNTDMDSYIDVGIWLNTDGAPPILPRENLTEEKRQAHLKKSREYYARQSSSLVNELKNAGHQVLYESKHAPLIFARLPVKDLNKLEEYPSVQAVYPSEKMVPELNVSALAIRADKAWEKGYTGCKDGKPIIANVTDCACQSDHPNLGVIEFYDPDFAVGPNYYSVDGSKECTHETAVVGIIASTHETYKGIAHGACLPLISANSGSFADNDIINAAEWAIEQGACVINCSWGFNTEGEMSARDRYFDHIVYTEHVTVVKSAGNIETGPSYEEVALRPYLYPDFYPYILIGNPGYISSPGLGWNVITVGGYDDAGTAEWLDDSMCSTSCYMNPISLHGDRQKPELVAPGVNITTLTIKFDHDLYPYADPNLPAFKGYNTVKFGTSFAAPHVAGAAALLMDYFPDLKNRPEQVAAILMASAVHDIEPGSDRDGAGGIDIGRAIEIIDKGDTDLLTLTYNDIPRNSDPFFATRGDVVRVVIRWLSHSNTAYIWNSPESDKLESDIDLQIFGPNGDIIDCSCSWDNNFEIVEFTAPESGQYTAQICLPQDMAQECNDCGDLKPSRFDDDSERIGIAWYVLYSFSAGQNLFVPANNCEGYDSHDFLKDLGQSYVTSISWRNPETGQIKYSNWFNGFPSGDQFSIESNQVYFICMLQDKTILDNLCLEMDFHYFLNSNPDYSDKAEAVEAVDSSSLDQDLKRALYRYFDEWLPNPSFSSDDFENGNIYGWTATGLWHQVSNSSCISPGYSSPTTSWYYGQDTSCNYNTGSRNTGSLTSPEIQGITSDSKLSFKYWRQVESFSGSFDKTYVEVSSDGGENWANVWYKDSRDASQAMWLQSEEISLADFAGNSILVRFSFDSVDSGYNNFNGWFIDDVSVSSESTSTACIDSISMNQTVDGSWTGDCDSTNRVDRYAKYYTFSLSSTTEVQIDLESGVDTFMYLLNGSGMDGSLITYNDDGGEGVNSRITITLSTGSYTIEATTFSIGATGDFTLSLAGTEQPVVDAVASYSFSEGTGTLTVDGSGVGNDGTIHGATWTDGKVGNGLHFDGINDWVEVADDPSLDLLDQITVEAWVNLDDLTDGGIIGKYDNWAEYNYCLWFEGGILYFEVGNANVFETKVSYSGISSGTWYHIAGTYDKQNVKLYVNGSNVATTAENRTMGNGGGPLCIGNVRYNGINTHSYNETDEFFRGKIDEISIYGIALSQAEIQNRYNDGGSGGSGDTCIDSIAMNQTVNGSWTSDCDSTNRPGMYAKYYTFSLSSTAEVQIDLVSGLDPFMYLLSGSGMDGSVIIYDDDGGEGVNSNITVTLSAGSYTIEATTYSSGITGDFTLYLAGGGQPVVDAVASYGFSEGTGTLTGDGSGTGNDGTIHGAAWTDGKVGNGLHFDGINDWVEVADDPSLDLIDQITVEAWVNLDDLTDGGIIGKYDNYSYYNYCLWFEGGILYFEIGNRSTSYFEKKVSYSGLNTGTWYHIVGTYDRQNVRLYVNASNVDTEPETREMGPGGGPLCIGNVRYNGINTHSYNETDAFFRGKVDEIRIYDYALSAQQVYDRYISF